VTGPPRDWDKELAEIDKIIAKQPAGGSPAPTGTGGPPLPAPRGAAAPASRAGSAVAPAGRRSVLTAWIRVLLGLAVAVGVWRWPYAHSCGLSLYGYLAAAGGVVLAGLWGTVTSWKRRLATAHTISLLVTLWGALLVGKVIADRTSYPRHPSTWSCP
jgi:hypothetical protein